MYDARMYPDRYSRFAGTISQSDSGRTVQAYGATATSTAQPCRLNLKGGQWKRKESGLTFDYDAELRVPETSTILPEKRGDTPDKVIITTFNGQTVNRAFTVVAVYSAMGQHKRAYLKELMP